MEILRKYFDYPAITTDVITGFPGETEEEFLITRNFLREIAFSDLHIFPYSPRRGTKAAAMTDQVDPQVKKHRSDLLIQDTKEYQKIMRMLLFQNGKRYCLKKLFPMKERVSDWTQ